jgi:hypothetical protein
MVQPYKYLAMSRAEYMQTWGPRVGTAAASDRYSWERTQYWFPRIAAIGSALAVASMFAASAGWFWLAAPLMLVGLACIVSFPIIWHRGNRFRHRARKEANDFWGVTGPPQPPNHSVARFDEWKAKHTQPREAERD